MKNNIAITTIVKLGGNVKDDIAELFVCTICWTDADVVLILDTCLRPTAFLLDFFRPFAAIASIDVIKKRSENTIEDSFSRCYQNSISNISTVEGQTYKVLDGLCAFFQ